MAASQKKKAPLDPSAIMKSLVEREAAEDDGCAYVYGDEAERVISAPKYYYSTGLSLLDGIIGNGGLGSGRISEIFGPNKTGKSELLQRIMEHFLTDYPNGLAFYYDQELALDDVKLKRVPVFRTNRFAILNAETLEKLLMRLQVMLLEIHASCPDTPILVGIDSLAAIETDEERGKDLDENTMMGMARVLSKAFRKIRRVLQQTSAHLIFLNQIRQKPNQMPGQEPESPGGEALKFWADYRIRTKPAGTYYIKPKVKKDGPLEENDRIPPDGLLIQFKTEKNKLATPLRSVSAPLLFRHAPGSPSGLSEVWSLHRQLKVLKSLDVRGGRYFLDGVDESFSLEEWPMFYQAHKDRVVNGIIQPWLDAIMFKEDAVDVATIVD